MRRPAGKAKLAQLLEVSSRHAPVRLAAQRLSRRGLVPENALQFMHAQEAFSVPLGARRGSFRYLSADADVVGRRLFYTALTRWEAETMREFIPMAQQARGFLDVGAFTGAYSLVAATANPALRAVAFEPVPAVYQRLVANVAVNDLQGRITTVPMAVSDRVGTASFYIPDREMPDTGHLASSSRQSSEAGTWHEVATTTLAAALPAGFAVDLIKIDVEDAEGPVVESMADVLAEHRPAVIVELLASGSHAHAADVLLGLGYRLFHLRPEGRLPVTRPEPVPGDPCMNFLCLPS